MFELFGRKKIRKSVSQEERWEEFLKILRDSTEYEDEVLPEHHLFYDLGLSSMEIMILIGDLEDQMDVKLEISRLKTVKTVGDLFELL